MTPTGALAIATTVDVRTVSCTGQPQPCERDCGSERGVVRVYAPTGLVQVCLGCARTAIGAALDDSPPDAVVVVELETYPGWCFRRRTPDAINPAVAS